MSDGVEYRVVWKRVGIRSKHRPFARRASADRFVRLFGPEPWTYLGRDPDAYVCCSGYNCGCGGETYRQANETTRRELPHLEWFRIEQRGVEPWSTATTSSPAEASPPPASRPEGKG